MQWRIVEVAGGLGDPALLEELGAELFGEVLVDEDASRGELLEVEQEGEDLVGECELQRLPLEDFVGGESELEGSERRDDTLCFLSKMVKELELNC